MTVIDFQEYKINAIIKNINKLNHEQIKDLLAVLLSEYSSNHSISIVKLSKRLGINVYKKSLPTDVGAKIIIDSALKDTHGSNIIIEVNENHPKVVQRFSVARELAYYLFNILEKTSVTSETFIEETYYINEKNDAYKEIAMNILLPDSSFCEDFLHISKTGNLRFTERYLSHLYKVPKNIVKQKIKKL